MNTSTATVDTPLQQAWPRAQAHGQAGRLAARAVDILFQVCLPASRLRVPVSHGVAAVSSRTVMNNVGSLLFKPMVTKAFRADGFYERFPAKGQLERVRKIHQRLLDAIVG
ncbi:MAG: hypothetical protein E8D48_00505 [Nitrospira sp.]|nr:MAG: hypothetical protein E8D48_00505 [Nitrospira sp.]